MREDRQEIVTDEELFSNYAKHEEKLSFTEIAKGFVKEECSALCTREKAKKIVNSVLPITKWLPEYNVSRDLLSDIAAGITVGVVHLPQGMAYALLAQLAPVNGLYTSFFPVLVYALFGTTKHLSVGTFAIIALMVAEAISKHLPECPEVGTSTTFVTPLQNTTADSRLGNISAISAIECNQLAAARSIEIAIALCVAVALIHFGMYVFRLGILHVYLSSHMVSGFTCGAAFHVFTSQVPSLLGIRIARKTGLFSIVYTYIELFRNITSINWATVLISLCNSVFLITGKEINRRYSARLPFPIPWELGVVIFSTIASTFGYFHENYDVRVVGEIPQGIQTSIPNGGDIGMVFPEAIPISIVTFSISISLSLLFSEKHAYTVDANQELLAYSLANIVGSFFSCFPCAASLSRSLVWEQSGGRTQLTGCIAAVLVLITLLWIGPLFEKLPTAALAAIIMVNLKNLLKQFNKLMLTIVRQINNGNAEKTQESSAGDVQIRCAISLMLSIVFFILIPSLWKVSKLDAITWLVTWATTVFLGVDIGLYVGVAFSLFIVVLRTQITYGDIMVAVSHENIYRSSKRFEGSSDTDIVIFKFPSPLIYANQMRFKHQLSGALHFKPEFEVALRKRAKDQAEQSSKKRSKIGKHHPRDNREPMVIRNSDQDSPTTSIVVENDTTGVDRITANGIKMPMFVILDMSICSFIDNDGVILLTSLLTTMSELNIRLLLARCSADVRRCLLNGGFPKADKLNEDSPVFFVSLEKAVAYARQQKNLPSELEVPHADTFTPTKQTVTFAPEAITDSEKSVRTPKIAPQINSPTPTDESNRRSSCSGRSSPDQGSKLEKLDKKRKPSLESSSRRRSSAENESFPLSSPERSSERGLKNRRGRPKRDSASIEDSKL